MTSLSSAMLELDQLNSRFGIPDRIVFEHRFGGFVASLAAPGGLALLSLQGAQVLSYIPTTQAETLWLTPQLQLGTGKPVRGGIPICWPWFGQHPEAGGRPAHGFVRAAPWRVIATRVSGEITEIEFAFDAADMRSDLWANRAIARLRVTIGTALTVALETENSGDNTLMLTQALHTYLAVGEVTQVVVKGLSQRPYINQLSGADFVQQGALRIEGETDRIYFDTQDPVVVEDPVMARQLEVRKDGSRSTVVWNPGITKSNLLGDMGTEGYRRMLCVETSNAGPDVVTLAPGERHLITQILRSLPQVSRDRV